MDLLLASASPRRADLLHQAGVSFRVIPAHVEEVRRNGEAAQAYVRRLAREKAEVVSRTHPEFLCLAADTVVVFQEQVLEKPVDASEASQMLHALSGTQHRVMTGFCLTDGKRSHLEVVETTVIFRSLTNQEISAYVQSGASMDKAGAYGIQAGAAHMVSRIEGSYTNVVGLPMAEVMQAFRTFIP